MIDSKWIETLHGNLGIVFSSLLRSMLIPSTGKELYVADFSKIEVAVCWWKAGNIPGIKILRSGKDPYKYQAAENTGKTYEEIDDEGPERQLGKAQILGCQFGMGSSKFQSTAYDLYRLKLTKEQSKLAVKSYREANSAVPELWKLYEQAAITAIEEDVQVKVGKCTFFCADNFLWIELPSGRRLAYREPQINWRVREFDVDETFINLDGEEETVTVKVEGRPQKTVEFMAVNSKSKKWWLERTWGGTLTENIVQACARDIMMYGLPKLERAGYPVLLTVHDEVICEKTTGEGSIEEFTKILCERPKWADEDLIIEAKGWKGPRYKK